MAASYSCTHGTNVKQEKPFPYAAVIFDLDGVLADTEPINFRSVQDLVTPTGIQLDAQDYRSLYGLDYYDTAEYLRSRYQLDESVSSLALRQEAFANRRIENEIVPAQGAKELLQRLADGAIPTGLASNSPRSYVRLVLRCLGLDGHFPFPVARDDVPNGKPYPDPYLEACKRLGVDPVRCLAVEDSPVGVASAVAAGLAVAVVGPHSSEISNSTVNHSPDLSGLAAFLFSA